MKTLVAVPETREETASCEEQNIHCLLDVFRQISCPRDPRGRQYSLASVLGLYLVGTLSGSQNVSQVARFGENHPRLLERLGFKAPQRPRNKEERGRIRCPNEDTIGRIFGGVNPEEMNEKFILFLGEAVKKGSVAAVDGKKMRGTGDYVLSVFVNRIRQVVWQTEVRKEENENSALERDLATILEEYPRIKIFTGDAMYCQKKIVETFVRAKRDYLLQLKGSQGTDHALARDSFRQISAGRFPEARSVEKRGGRKAPRS